MANAQASTASSGHVEGQTHPLGVYFKIWILLFVLSAFSYAVDYFHVEGTLRWVLILVFMLLKAGFIMAVFMHLMWERMALVTALILPPIALYVFVALMAYEGQYVEGARDTYFGPADTSHFTGHAPAH